MFSRYAAGQPGPTLSTPSSSSAREKLRSFLDHGSSAKASSEDRESGLDLRALDSITQGIDWETQSSRFLAGDFIGLLTEEKAMLDALVDDPTIAEVLKSTGLPHRLVLLAWLAKQFVTHSRAAERFANKVLGQITNPDILREIQKKISKENGWASCTKRP